MTTISAILLIALPASVRYTLGGIFMTLLILMLIYRRKVIDFITKRTWLSIATFACICLMILLSHKDTILIYFSSCLLAILVYKIIEDSSSKGASIFTTMKDDRIYLLSFIYKDGRDLRGNGMENLEIQKELKTRYEKKSFPFQMYSPSEKNRIRAQENLDFVYRVICNENMLFNYVLVPEWADMFDKLLELYNKSEEQKNVHFMIQSILIDKSDDNVQRWIYVFKNIFRTPYIIYQFDPEAKQAANAACIYDLFCDKEWTSYFSHKPTFLQLAKCIELLIKLYPSIEQARKTQINENHTQINIRYSKEEIHAIKNKYTVEIQRLIKEYNQHR